MYCDEMRPNENKVYVSVIAHHRLDGEIIPLRFKAEDGPAQHIVRVLEWCPSHSLKAGGQGIRYTCMLDNGNTIYLFHDRKLWFHEK